MRRLTPMFAKCLVIGTATLLVGCGDEKPQTVVAPVTPVEQMNAEISGRLEQQKQDADKAAAAAAETADRIRFVEVLQDPLDKWGELYNSLPGKPPKEVVEIGAKMAAIRAEMTATPTTPCTFTAREKIFRGMDQVNSVMEAFKSVKGDVPEELPKRLGIGETTAREGARDLLACNDVRTR